MIYKPKKEVRLYQKYICNSLENLQVYLAFRRSLTCKSTLFQPSQAHRDKPKLVSAQNSPSERSIAIAGP